MRRSGTATEEKRRSFKLARMSQGLPRSRVASESVLQLEVDKVEESTSRADPSSVMVRYAGSMVRRADSERYRTTLTLVGAAGARAVADRFSYAPKS